MLPQPTNQIPPSNLQNNTAGNLPSQSQDVVTMNTSDAQAIASGQGIPGWVKQIIGWWVEGKVSDNDFVTAIKFLVHQGIIKL
jgi:hypothetical protein